MDDDKKIKEIIQIGLELNQIKDIDVLLERVLLEARKASNADAGSIYTINNNQLEFRYSQNATLQKRLETGKKLIYSKFSMPVNNNSIAGYVACSGELLNIPDVHNLPSGLPFTFARKYDEASQYVTQSMLTIPLKTHRGSIIGVLQLINAKNEDNQIVPFTSEEELYIKYFANTAANYIEQAQMTRTMILRMINMAELRDPKETGAHVNRVGAYSVEIYEHWARKHGISEDEIEKNKDILRIAAMLHDVGKVAISDTILKKPGKLTFEEFDIMKQHTYMGARLFSTKHSEIDEASYQIALNHHEKWNGNGYPGYIDPLTALPLPGYEDENGKARGKKEEEIPPFGRIVAIADVFDALSCRRVYKEAWGEAEVLETLKKDSGTHFDPDMIDSFFAVLDLIRMIFQQYTEEEA